MNQIKADEAIGKTLTRIWKDSTELVLFFGDEWVHYESEEGVGWVWIDARDLTVWRYSR